MDSQIKLLYIDLFCGAGGTSTGVERAKVNGRKCAKVIACVNHDANAIASHAANHPDGYEIDRENSTFECIKFKPIVKKWRDSNPEITGFYLGSSGITAYFLPNSKWDDGNRNVFATEKQAKSALAMAQISQIMANDERFGGVVTYEEWDDRTTKKYVIFRMGNKIFLSDHTHAYTFLAFHTAEQRDLFLEENEDLVKDYLMID